MNSVLERLRLFRVKRYVGCSTGKRAMVVWKKTQYAVFVSAVRNKTEHWYVIKPRVTSRQTRGFVFHLLIVSMLSFHAPAVKKYIVARHSRTINAFRNHVL